MNAIDKPEPLASEKKSIKYGFRLRIKNAAMINIFDERYLTSLIE